MLWKTRRFRYRFRGNPRVCFHIVAVGRDADCYTGAAPSLTMSVLVQSSQGWALDARSLIDQGYPRCIRFKDQQKSHVKCRFKRQCFQILKSHYSVSARAAVGGGNTDMLKTDKPTKVNPAARGSKKWLYWSQGCNQTPRNTAGCVRTSWSIFI